MKMNEIPVDIEVRDLLNAAANTIERYGWEQRQWGSRGQGFCVLGAMIEATPNACLFPVHKTFDRARTHLRNTIQCESLTLWNDEEAQSQEQVVRVMRAAAETA